MTFPSHQYPNLSNAFFGVFGFRILGGRPLQKK